MPNKLTIKDKIIECVKVYSNNLKQKTDKRLVEMKGDDNSHYLIYRVLVVTSKEGELIDIYQNKGRFLYKYAGSFLEEVTILCLEERFEHAQRKVKILNKLGSRPKTFEIDCLVDKEAYEIKWRDSTTDGDHITKEHTRVKSIKDAGYKPIRIMFYYPNRTQAIRIQETLRTIYAGMDGEYFFGDEAWSYIKKKTRVDLKLILEEIAREKTKG
ncbi:MAG: ApaLI family restriction endonuclease [bacterium]